jgi:hypothetical protein
MKVFAEEDGYRVDCIAPQAYLPHRSARSEGMKTSEGKSFRRAMLPIISWVAKLALSLYCLALPESTVPFKRGYHKNEIPEAFESLEKF